jgi:hypothetical protein
METSAADDASAAQRSKQCNTVNTVHYKKKSPMSHYRQSSLSTLDYDPDE